MLILPGFGDSGKGRKHQKDFFGDVGYDLYIPDFTDRKSFEGTLQNINEFYYNHELDKYSKVHVFSYIMGSWVINSFINENGKKNISTIVYDWSPLQERAPKIIAEKMPLLGIMKVGKVLVDLSNLEYPPIEKQGISIGIIVESKATPLIRIFKKQALSYGKLNWSAASFNQVHDDLIYTRLNHDQMYILFDVIGEDILNFIKFGKFKEASQRTPYDWDIFSKN